jgi:hypothetical protein
MANKCRAQILLEVEAYLLEHDRRAKSRRFIEALEALSEIRELLPGSKFTGTLRGDRHLSGTG